MKECFTRRFEAKEFHEMKTRFTTEFITKIRNIYKCSAIPAYRTKESFGDLDVVYCTFDDQKLTKTDITEHFANSKQVIQNGDVISLEYNELQVDIIHVNIDNFFYALDYFSWNDCGNLIGRIAHKFGVKHGHRGLTLPLRYGDNMFDEVLLTTRYDRALEFLGFDSQVFNKGFDTLEEVFNFIVSNHFFTAEAYKLENLNTIARTRDKKRPTYNKFLQFIEQFDSQSCYNFETNKNVYLNRVFAAFPDAVPQFETAMKELALRKMAREKFNGDIVSTITGFTDKKLGQFMSHLRKQRIFQPAFVIYLSDADIREHIIAEMINFVNN